MPMKIEEVLNSKGEPMELNDHEMRSAQRCEEVINSLGYNVPITTLTAINKRVSEQKFFQIAPADYMPVKVGENSWSDQIISYRDYNLGGDFETGIINTAEGDSRIAEVSSGVDTVVAKVINWAKTAKWTIPQLQMAAKSGNWDIVSSKERARKRNWDLGVQRTAFLGLNGDASVKGLLTMTGVNANTSLLSGNISDLSVSGFQTFCADVLQAYRANCNYTAYPTHFIIPEADFNGLGTAVDETFNLKSRLQRLEEIFKGLTNNPSFQIKPLAYANQAQNVDVSGLNKNRYTLLNYDEDSLCMEIPVDYTSTVQNTTNGFQFENVAYGQFTGVVAKRELETLYIDWAA